MEYSVYLRQTEGGTISVRDNKSSQIITKISECVWVRIKFMLKSYEIKSFSFLLGKHSGQYQCKPNKKFPRSD